MKITAEITGQRLVEPMRSYKDNYVIVKCTDNVKFRVPPHMAEHYHIGRTVNVEVNLQ